VLDAAQLAWLDRDLAAHRDRPTIVFVHHHPWPLGHAWMDTMPLRNGHELMTLLGRHAQVRWLIGGHVHSDYLNSIALGICLVGDFNRDQPNRAQLESCEELIRYLRQRCGKVGDHYPIVKPHREINPPRWPTDCPGDVFPYSWFRRFQE